LTEGTSTERLSTKGVVNLRFGSIQGHTGLWLEVESTNGVLGVWLESEVLDLEDINGLSTLLLELESIGINISSNTFSG